MEQTMNRATGGWGVSCKEQETFLLTVEIGSGAYIKAISVTAVEDHGVLRCYGSNTV
jgi:hypothetical protein